MKKFLIIDGNAILHRSFHALPSLTGKNGPVGAVFGFFSMLLKALKEIKADFLVVCFDYPAPTFRHQQFIGYQIKRPKMDPALTKQVDLTQLMVKKIGIPIFSQKGFEADDLIATISQKLKKKPIKVIILTGDRDLMQLVSNKINLLMPIQGLSQTKIIGPTKVKEYLGLAAKQVVDFKALVGDPSDNYPGIPGIGPKTAVKLLDQYFSLSRIYENLDKIEPGLRKKLKDGQKAAKLSYQLAKVVKNAPLEFNLGKAVWNEQKLKNMAAILREYHFPSLLKRLEKDFELNLTNNKDQQMSLI